VIQPVSRIENADELLIFESLPSRIIGHGTAKLSGKVSDQIRSGFVVTKEKTGEWADDFFSQEFFARPEEIKIRFFLVGLFFRF
jgi:hypothetical protein